jgi:ATP-dependent RNA helicase SUPV3L1/SUV3
VTRHGDVLVEGHPVGRIDGLRFEPDATVGGADKRVVLRAARRALGGEMPRRIAEIEAAQDGDFALRPDRRIVWHGAPIARLRRGASILAPAIEVAESEFLDGASRERVRARLARLVLDHVSADLAPLFRAVEAAKPDPQARGLLHRLQEGAGLLKAAELGADLAPSERAAMKTLGVKPGHFAIFLPTLLKPRPAALRALLWSAWHEIPAPDLPAPGLISITDPGWPDGFADFMGWVPAGPRLIRLDIAERVGGDLARATRRHPVPLDAGLASRLSIGQAELASVLRGLGFRLIAPEALADGVFGPPAPTRIAALRPAVRRRREKRQKPPHPPRVNPDHPFAALAVLRRAAG